MGRRVRRVPVNLNIDDLRPVPFEEIKVILRCADPIIMSDGRTLLYKILKRLKEIPDVPPDNIDKIVNDDLKIKA
jgi:hypothetical protein